MMTLNWTRFVAAGLAAAALTLAGPASAAGVRSLILGDWYGLDSDLDGVRTDLIGSDARFDQANSSSLNLRNGLPTLATLGAYDSILVFTDSVNVNLTDLSDLLGDYVDAGGGVVLSTFWGQQAGQLGGKINSSGYNPLTNPTGNAYNALILGAFNAAHPLMDGVATLSQTQYGGDYLSDLDAGAVLVASWDDGRPLAALNGAGSVAYVSLNPNNFVLGHASGDYARLFANALAFTADGGSVVPEPGTWALMIVGFGAAGSMIRARRRRIEFA